MRPRLFAALLFAAAGCDRVPTAGALGLAGRLTDPYGRPVANARITRIAALGARRGEARSDGFGRFALAPARPPDGIEIDAAGYCPLRWPESGARSGGLGPGQTLALTLLPRLDVGPDRLDVGFGSEVDLVARLNCPPPSGPPPRFRWRRLGGDVAALSSTFGPRIQVRLPALGALQPLDGRFLPLGFSPRSAGEVVLAVTAETGGTHLDRQVRLRAAGISAGTFGVPVGAPAYVRAPEALAERAAAGVLLEKSPPRSEASLRDGLGRAPQIRPDRSGEYVLVARATGEPLRLFAGRWDRTPRDCNRPECHPVEAASYGRSLMATVFDRALDGTLGSDAGPYGAECVPCHVTGYDEAADSGGFDDVAREIGWRLPDRFERGNRAELPRDLARLANVQCLGCHGPGHLAPRELRSIVLRVEVCAQCHDAPPRYPKVLEWRSSAMARSLGPYGALDPAADAACARCHTAQGFIASTKGGRPPVVPHPRVVQPITCAACHDPHSAQNRHQVRVTGGAEIPSGRLDGLGAGALCARCHNAGAPPDAMASTLPMAPQTEVVAGVGALGVGSAAPPAVHRGVPDFCVGCHMRPAPAPATAAAVAEVSGHTFLARSAGGATNAESCTPCHGAADVWTSVAAEIEALRRTARAAVATAIDRLGAIGCADGTARRAASVGAWGDRLALVDGRGRPTGDCNDNGRLDPSERPFPAPPSLYGPAYDLLLVERDRSKGLHNPAYARAILRSVINRLGRYGSESGTLGSRRTP